MQNLPQVVDRLKAGGFRMVTSTEAPPNVQVKDDIGVPAAGPVTGIAYTLSQDDVKVELVENKAQALPVMSHQRSRYSVATQGGVKALRQHRVSHEAFQTPSDTPRR